jgi:hypothetical protein
MFRAISCLSTGRQIVLIQHLVPSLSVSDRPVHIITHVWNRGPITTGYCMPLYFLYFIPPSPPVHNLVPCPHICIRSSCACHVKRFGKIPHYRMHDVTISASVTSFEFLVSEIFNGNIPSKHIHVKICVSIWSLARVLTLFVVGPLSVNNDHLKPVVSIYSTFGSKRNPQFPPTLGLRSFLTVNSEGCPKQY